MLENFESSIRFIDEYWIKCLRNGSLAAFLYIFLMMIGIITSGNAFAKPPEATRYQLASCNAISFAALPGRDGWFISREKVPTNPWDRCSGHSWKLVLSQVDENTHRYYAVRDVLPTPTIISNGARLRSAYDPAVVTVNGDIWVAFECAGPGLPGTSTCVGPLEHDTMDPAKVYVIVTGRDPRDLPYTYSASDPKFLQDGGKTFLYWSTIQARDQTWLYVGTRGMELTYDRNRAQPLLPKDTDTAVRSIDPVHTVEVWSNADIFSIQPWNGRVIATAAATGPNCVRPNDRPPGCYRAVIGISAGPLVVDGFSEIKDLENQLPSNPCEYVRLIIRPDGHAEVVGKFDPPLVPNDRDLQEGLYKIPITLP